MSLPSMKHPIQYAFTYPERLPSADMQVNFKELGKMTFFMSLTVKLSGVLI